MRKSGRLIRFGVSMEESLLLEFDSLCAAKSYESRSEALRDIIRDLLIESDLRQKNTRGIGTLTLVYDHRQRDLDEKLTDYQHHHLNLIISTVHIHLDRRLCLEVLILRGKTELIKKVADGLIATKGVKHGKLVLSTAGVSSR